MANIKLNSSSSTQDKQFYFTIVLILKMSTLILKKLNQIHTATITPPISKHFILLFYFISIFILLTRRKATEALIRRVSINQSINILLFAGKNNTHNENETLK